MRWEGLGADCAAPQSGTGGAMTAPAGDSDEDSGGRGGGAERGKQVRIRVDHESSCCHTCDMHWQCGPKPVLIKILPVTKRQGLVSPLLRI
jgi:hypothetical protein